MRLVVCITPISLAHTSQQPASLIQHIQPIPLQQLPQNTFCVFLVTPSFAQWLGNDGVFVQKALSAVYSTWLKELGEGVMPSTLEVDVLCAVVDKLPSGRAPNPNNTLEDEVFARSTQPPVSESGFEGIAYVTLPSAASVSSAAPVSPDKGAIDFIIPEHTETPGGPRDILRLPLANTIFQTGTPRTMILSKWKLSQSEQTEETKQPMELISKTDISHHGIRITRHDPTMSSVTSALSLPLIPLTHGRQVNGCMGNIIRQVVGPEKAIVTASSELEEVVPRFFKSRGEPVQATTVWALVVPRQLQARLSGRTVKMLKKYVKKNEKGQDDENKLWERLWQHDPPHWYHLASKALLQGARLHRVLSGGGGWGKKAGLLALDPVPMTRIDRRISESSSRNSAIASEDPEDLASALAPVVQEGDYIQFFISPVPASASGVDPSIERQKLAARPQDKTCGWEIGTIPSTADSMPGGSWQHAPSAANHISVFQNNFGALSEGGLTFTRRFQLRNQGKAKQVLFEGVGTTTIDVPFSRFWAIEVAEKGFAKKNQKLALREQKSLKKAVRKSS
ncbi:hypothetical protein IQ07DRAFT_521787 [Pyrenochaeta sp. DS3sAY3a]|nr:hypothetical protein IQ07DRAFT_521787 [Pyrenochaeta sp. DS3sAY3a]